MDLRVPSNRGVPRRSGRRRRTDTRLLVGGAFVLLAVQWAHAVSGFGGAGAEDFFGRWGYDAIVTVCGVSLLAHGLSGRCARGPWLLLGAGLVSKLCGDVIYSLAGNLAAVPVPSVSDPFWLALYPCAYLSLLLLVRDRVRTALAASRLDGVICGVTVAAAMACITLPTAFSTSAGASFWEQATNLAYPVCDLVLIGAIVSAIALSGWRLDRTLGTLALAILAWVTADVMYLFSVHGTAGDVADALVLTGAAGMALAATLDRPAGAPAGSARARRERGLFVPVACGAVALVILIGGAALRLEIAGLSLAALGLGLVLIRMMLALSENDALLHESRAQALTDPLTGLGNRRQLKLDLAAVLDRAGQPPMIALVMLDLNGFKTYNDTFGHAAGDSLLAQLATSLKAAVRGRGEAYRLGGDEFCVLAPCTEHTTEVLAGICHRALATHGDGFSITAAYGVALVPAEAQDASAALALADARMYSNKAGSGRPQVAGELARVLTAMLQERAPALASHSQNVCHLALEAGASLDLARDELEALRHAAMLHDLGKMAIPDSILHKPGPLSTSEREMLHQHPIIGQRILAVTPAMERAARLVRGSHERYDGEGYPDHLRAQEIPLASRIIAVADAYDAMTTARRQRSALTPAEALAELRRCSGSQFDPHVTAAFELLLSEQPLAGPAQ